MKKAKLNARILSLVLALCMVFQFIPSAGTAAQAAEDSIVVNMLNMANGGAASVPVFTGYNAEKDPAKVWYYDAENSDAIVSAVYATQLRFQIKAGQKASFKVYAAKAGIYNLTVNSVRLGSVKAEINGKEQGISLTTQYADGYDTPAGMFTLNQGWNTVNIIGVASHSDSWLRSFSFDFVSEYAPVTASFLNMANGGGASVPVFTGYNEEKDPAKIWYYDAENSDAVVAAVYNTQLRAQIKAGQKMTFKIYAEKAGAYNLTVNAVRLGTLKAEINGASQEIALTTEYADGLDIEAGLVKVNQGWNTLTLTGVANHSDAYLRSFTLTYETARFPIVASLLNLANGGGAEASLAAVTGYNSEKDPAKTWYYDAENSTGALQQVYFSQVRYLVKAGEKLAFKIYADEAGAYDLTINAAILGSLTAKVGNIGGAAVLGTQNNNGVDVYVGEVLLDKGWNTLSLTGVNPNNSVFLREFILKYKSESAAKAFDISFTAHISHSPNWGPECPGFADFAAYNQNFGENTWRFLAEPSEYTGAGALGGATGTVRTNLNATGWAAFDIYVPEEGYYNVDFDYTSWANSVTVNVAIDGHVLGQVNTAGDADTRHTARLDKGIKLSKGMHKLLVSKVGTAGANVGLRGFNFTPATEPAATAEVTVIDFADFARTNAMHTRYTDADIAKYGWTISNESTKGAYESGNTRVYNAGSTAIGLIGLPENGDTAVFDFNIAAPGYYYVSSASGIASAAMEIEVSVDGKSIGMLGATHGIELKGANPHKVALKKISGTGVRVEMSSITFTPGEAPVLDGITLDKETAELEIGGKETLTAILSPAGVEAEIIWETSADSVATVKDGVVTAVGAGQAVITAKAGEFSATCTVTVMAPEPEYEQGDINGDGRVNTRDVTNLRRYLAGGYEDSITVIPEMIDVNGDGRENTRDVAALRAIIAG